ncbi:MAG: hypothetical protein HC853_00715 [Anaerolineae bacterium]|nr:hypothetical protein [Anaerolineae bacterium]
MAKRIGATPEIETLAQRVKQTKHDAAVKVVEADAIDMKPLKAKAALFWATDGQFIFAHAKDGKVYYSPRRYDSVRTAFDDGQVALEWLPPNTVLSAQGPKGRIEAMFFPPAQYQLICQYDDIFEGVVGVTFTPSKLAVMTLPMPGFLFAGYDNDYRLMAISGNTFDAKSRLYQVPLPNCYTHGGICWGNNEKPPAGKGGLLKAWQVFWKTYFTTASVQQKSRAFPDDIRKRIVAVVGHATYPMDDLVPAQVTPTQLIKELLGGRS